MRTECELTSAYYAAPAGLRDWRCWGEFACAIDRYGRSLFVAGIIRTEANFE
jgi:hypothetical protein